MTTIFTTLTSTSCCHTGCGVVFGIESGYMDDLKKSHGSFCCPNGHRQHFTAETEAERLKRQLQQTENCLSYARKDVERLRGTVKVRDRQVSARKGIITRMKRRLVAGRCVCCSKQFKDLESHMKNQHPSFDPEKAAQVLSEKARA